MEKYILRFSDIDESNAGLVGFKAVSLSAMKKSGINVPDGFLVTTEAYKAFLRHNDLTRLLTNIMITKEESEELREQIKNAEIPDDVYDEIKSALDELSDEEFYAVRSSAVGEDSLFASFAGQQDTFLNVTEENIKKTILGCFASLFTDKVIYYRIHNSVKVAEMAVIIEKMIPAHIAGVMFTSDPSTGSRDIISIEASFGLGASIVSGVVSPDVYKFDKTAMTILSRTISRKKKAVLPMSDGGTVDVDIPADHMSDPAISDETIGKLCLAAINIEGLFGCPQDIEWCMDSEDIYIVQSRPITTLFPTPESISGNKGMRTYFSLSHAQMMLDPISPMGISVLKMLMPYGDDGDSRYICSAGGRIYADASELLKSHFLRKKIPRYLEILSPLMGKAALKLVTRADYPQRVWRVKNRAWIAFFRLLPAILGIMKNYSSKDTEGMLGRINNLTRLAISDLRNEMEASNVGTRKLEIARKKLNIDNMMNQMIPLFMPGVISLAKLLRLEEKYLRQRKYTDAIVAGLEGNITARIGIMIGDMADFVRESDLLKKEFSDTNYKTLIQRISALDDCVDFQKIFSDFFKLYGMRCAGEIDMATERWQENPEYIAKAVMSIAETAEPDAHNLRNEHNKLASADMEKEFIEEVSKKQGWFKARKIKRLIKTCKDMLPAREHPKHLIVNLMQLFKNQISEEALKLVEAGLLETKNDVFYCEYSEFLAAVKAESSLKDIVIKRKEEYIKYNRLIPPYVMTSEGEAVTAAYEKPRRDAIFGVPTSSGVVEGTARVIKNYGDDVVKKGEILVAPFLDSGATPMLVNAAGIVMENGGILSHGTIIAREYGLPAVAGVENALLKIKTGDKIRVDGNLGYIEFIKDITFSEEEKTDEAEA